MRNKQTLEEFINYMKEKPRTYGFDAILAYDRLRANRLLLQEYIDRFDGDMYFEPLTFTTVITPGTQWEKVIDHVLDKPRLTFENASIASSRADLRMRISGGKQLTLSRAAGDKVKKITRVKQADALDGPSLHVRITLDSSPGSVSSAGTVYMDLKRAEDFYLSFADTNEENRLGGQRYKDIFDTWPDEKKQFILNEMSIHANDFLQPGKFTVRTHAAPEGTLSTSAAFGDGEILLFVTMKNSNNDDAGIPYDDASMNYMLPDAKQPYTLNLVLGNKFLVERLITRGFQRLPHQDKPFTVVPIGGDDEDTHVTGIRATNGMLNIPDIEGSTDRLRSIKFTDGFPLPFSVTSDDKPVSFVCQAVNEKLRFTWNGAYPVEVNVTTRADRQVIGTLDSRWEWQTEYEFSIETSQPDAGKLYLQRVGSITQRLKMAPAPEFTGLDGFEMEELVNFAEQTLTANLLSTVDTIVEVAEEIDAFRLNGLLFRSGKDAAQPHTVRFPGDLTLPGYLSPSRAEFEVQPMEPIVVVGNTQQFTTTLGASASVTWSVENLPGQDDEDSGSINASGLYTAPRAETVTRGDKRVIIKATSGSAFSKALVSIAPRSIAASPYVMQAAAGGQFKVSAASHDGEALKFELADGAIGRLEVDPNPDPSVQQGMLYIAPELKLSEVPRKSDAWLRHRDTLDWNPDDDIFEVLKIDTIEVSRVSGGAKESIPVVVPLESETHWFVHEVEGESVRLRFMGAGKDGEYEVPAEDTTWYLIHGNGQFENGVYTPKASDDEPLSRFAVVAAIEYDRRMWLWTYAILPLPLVSAQVLVDSLKDDSDALGEE
ncbi:MULTISPECIES: hypothetical protein [unclassified Pseudomonas]|uniref:hypothetical protein n=1 Tax=unclassified Pseudomonas TaxID=196821 RepID=UPI0035BF8B36